jgi:hypothetical protein
MFYSLTYQVHGQERCLSAAEQRAADARIGEAAAALRDLRLRLGRAVRPSRRALPGSGGVDAVTAAGAAAQRVAPSVR